MPFSRSLAAFALVGVITFIAYLPSFHATFQFDDYGQIIENANERVELGLEGLSWMGGSRVIPSLTFMWNFAVGREDPFGYHVVNFAVHLTATLGVFLLALGLRRSPRLRDTAIGAYPLRFATAAAFLFACHPIQTQAVTYVIQRMASMSAMFFVWAVALYVWGRNRQAAGTGRAPWAFAGAFVVGVCALLSKENAIVLPFAVLLTEVCFYTGWGALRRVYWLVPAIGLALVLGIGWRVYANWIVLAPKGNAPFWSKLPAVLSAALRISVESLHSGLTPLQYFLTQCTVLPRYLGLVLLPWGLNVDHDVAVRRGPDLPVIAGAVLLLLLLALGLAAVRRRPLLGYGILWSFLALGLESSFMPINDLMMEHRVYLAMPGLALIFAGAFVVLAHRWPRAATGLALLAVVGLPAATHARNRVWRTPVSLWSDAARKSPRHPRVHLNLGVAYHMAGEVDRAIAEYCRTLALEPSRGLEELARDNLEIAVEERGDLAEVMREALSGSEATIEPDGSVRVEYDVAGVVCP